MKKPIIAITMGDPVGVGPEIILKALRDKRVRKIASPVVFGDAGVLNHVAGKLGLKPLSEGEVINVSALDLKTLKPGKPTRESGLAMISYIEGAVRMASNRSADAIVTAPISKEAAKKAGFGFPGHTEFIAHLTDTKDFAMMLGGVGLKVILVTIHEAIRDVPKLVTRQAVLKTLKITDNSFKKFFGFKKPRIAVAGLNPHAGEGGMFGDEEKKAIAPAIKKARALGINAIGPLPPDTVFYRAVKKEEFDCVVCMYHDQGLGPLKLLHFEDGINATLGLPIIRTSVDHGTAYDIAWKGVASPESLISAIEIAADMANKWKK
ncbi:MAG: 4-hydroxythreonine-4-phosphate dehydrogenase PdxA [Deltaproteobacteria bacterium]|nr:4-hydroxythreonine-4-phosphate dehydrogenase PdxA [Deltaproteobacteria bacterium]